VEVFGVDIFMVCWWARRDFALLIPVGGVVAAGTVG